MKFFNDLKYSGFYPLATWYMPIHCDNCHYEGKCAANKYNSTFFILSTLLVVGLIYSYFKFSGSTTLVTGGVVVIGAYLAYFFRAQKYDCPKCNGCYGTPLKFHQVLKK